MTTVLPHTNITPIGDNRPAAIPSLWNSRYTETDENFARLASFTPTGVCSTAGTTTAKAATCANFSLADGAFVIVKFTNNNTVAKPTLNVNSTGAKPIFYKGAAIAADQIAAGGVYLFRYDGTNWDVVGNVDDNTVITSSEVDTLFA